MTKIFVTGIPSWLGYNLVKAMNEGIPEVGIDRIKDKVIFFVQNNVNFTINQNDYNFQAFKLSGDITSFRDVYNALNTVNPDYIIHIAGIIHPKKIRDLYKVNTMGTSNIVESMKLLGLSDRRLVYISSNSSFGVRDYVMNEESKQIPYFNYGLSKYFAEQTIIENEINAVILNPCWFYGEGQPLRQTKLFEMIKKGKPLIIGDGSNLRSMTYTGNLAQAILLALNYEKDTFFCDRFWIADRRPYSVNEIYYTIARVLGVDIKPRYIPSIFASACRTADNLLQKIGMYSQYIHIAGEFDRNIACSSYKAMKELGYKPTVELEEGMRRSIEWINKRYKLCVS